MYSIHRASVNNTAIIDQMYLANYLHKRSLSVSLSVIKITQILTNRFYEIYCEWLPSEQLP